MNAQVSEGSVSTLEASRQSGPSDRMSAKQKRRLEMASWRPHQSTPFKMETFHFKTQQAQYVYHLGLVMAQKSLYFFYFTLPDTNEAVQAAERVVKDKVDKVETALNEEVARLTQIKEGELADAPTGYTKPLKLEVAMYCPEASRFGAIVRNYDKLVLLADSLWFAGFLSRMDRGQIIFNYRKMIIGLSRQLFNLSRQAKSAVVREKNKRKQKDAEKAARKEEARQAKDTDSVTVPEKAEDADKPTVASKAVPESTAKATDAAPAKPATVAKATAKTTSKAAMKTTSTKTTASETEAAAS